MKNIMDGSVRWKWLCLMFFILDLVFLVVLVSIWVIKDRQISHFTQPKCYTGIVEEANDNLETKDNDDVIAQLSHDEINHVMDYLHKQKDLNLKRVHEASISNSFVHAMELHTIPKQDLLNFLDNNGTRPIREAKVIMFRGDLAKPLIEEYIVGPLPNITYHKLANSSSKTTQVPYTLRPFSSFEFMAIYKYVIAKVASVARHVLLESYGATPMKCNNRCLRFSMTPISSAFLPVGKRKAWFWFAYDVEFYTLHPLDFQFLVDMTSSNPVEWEIQNVWYAKQLFQSLPEFLDQYKCKPINKTRIEFPTENQTLFSSLESRNPKLSELPQRPPRMFYPDGPRFKVGRNIIEYMSWKMFFRMSATAGLQFFNVRFDNERIIYELSMQEVAVMYSGYTPAARMLYYADSAALYGTRNRGLVPSVDCPENSQFVNTHFYSANEKGHRTYENAICVFELNTYLPVRRHRAYGRIGAFYGGLTTTVMVVRTITSVINYDYVVDYIFYQTGTVEVKVSLTGYLGTSFYYKEEDSYGAHLREHMNAGLHNHLFHFKVDLDVKGTKNRFETLDIGVENEPDPWFNENQIQQKYERNFKTSEMEAIIKYNFSTPKYLLVSNYNHTTMEHVPRSYRIQLQGISKQLLPQDYGFVNSVPWSNYQVAITRHRDSEEMSSSIYSMWDAADPVVNFRKYVEDDENIVDELSFFVHPFNYFDEDPSMRSNDAVRIVPKDKSKPLEGAVVERYTSEQRGTCLPELSLPDKMLAENSTSVFT
ncbi:hypothetical protein KUTeg_017546 [Tegillarca granosa]|uniref:Amine oxidase n=1 Tax=Tegillarca granosa TaxID=220873 RepID=A0ABQ9EF81_TEGGR|nr:hypothetical protein KUTeg_017546 [Tegillarca granosa]